MAHDDTMKPVPVRKRTAARLGAIQVNYEVGMTDKSLQDAMAQFLSHYAADIAAEMQVKKSKPPKDNNNADKEKVKM